MKHRHVLHPEFPEGKVGGEMRLLFIHELIYSYVFNVLMCLCFYSYVFINMLIQPVWGYPESRFFSKQEKGWITQ